MSGWTIAGIAFVAAAVIGPIAVGLWLARRPVPPETQRRLDEEMLDRDKRLS